MAGKTKATQPNKTQKTVELPEGTRGGDVLNSEVPEPSQQGPLDNGNIPQAGQKDSVAEPSSDPPA